MVDGAMRHGTTMDVEANYTDSHGQSEIGFGITRLLNFDLLPRIKRINEVKLYRPTAGDPDACPRLTPALTRPIRWEPITQQYDQMIKYATAVRTRTASTEAILRRFTRNAFHPAYAAMLEVGRAPKTFFVARCLRLRDLQREIEEGLNVMESSNGANSVIAYGKGGEIASNRRDEQEMFVLCLDPPVRPGVREHPDASGHPRRTGVGRRPHARRPARSDPAVLVSRPPVRGSEPRHGSPPEPRHGHRAEPTSTGGRRQPAASDSRAASAAADSPRGQDQSVSPRLRCAASLPPARSHEP